jgi:hypothetical protein
MLFYDPANSDPKICRHIRTKMSYVPSSDPDYVPELGTSAQHWCIRTMQHCGPDGHFVTPGECDHARECFEAPE